MQILILAKSIRNSNYCIAGRVARKKPDSNIWQIGEWIRPVSEHGEGEVSGEDCMCEGGNPPFVWDVVEIPIKAHANVKHQPEDYYLDTSQKWKKVEYLKNRDVSKIIQKPLNLWVQPGERLDRVSEEYLNLLNDVCSLYLIKPENLRFVISQKADEAEHIHKKRRAIFNYNSLEYNLSLTDPVIIGKYFHDYPNPGEPSKEIFPKNPEKCFIVVSLAALFKDNRHYKVVATVIEY